MQDEVHAVAFGPGGKTLATADGTTVRLWDAATGRELRQFRGQHALTHDVAIAPDGKIIAAGYDDGVIILWDTTTGREIRRGGDNSKSPSIAFAPTARPMRCRTSKGTTLGRGHGPRNPPLSDVREKQSGRSASLRMARPWLSLTAVRSGSATS